MPNFFKELKRRKVYQTSVAYAAVAFIVMQVVEIVFPIFEIPLWAGRFVIIILIIGTIYLLFIAPKLIPSRTVTSSLTRSYHLGGYLTEMRVKKDSPLVGKSCLGRSINQNYDVTVLDIIREKKHIVKI